MAGNRVLITGATGLLGREVYKTFTENGWSVLGLAYSRAKGDLVKVDLRDSTALEKVFDDFKPHVVVHSAAERRPDKMATDLEGSRQLNVTSSQTIATLCNKHDSFLIYMSTDYVFDGTSPPYTPDDKPNPLNDYGSSKRDGEVVTLGCIHSAVLRVPILYGRIETIDESAVTVIYNSVVAGKPVKLSDYEIRYPTHTIDVAKAIMKMASKSMSHPRSLCAGVWHFSAGSNYTKYAMARVIGEQLGVATTHIEAVRGPTGGVARPYNTQLDSSRTFEVFQCHPTLHFEDTINGILKPFV